MSTTVTPDRILDHVRGQRDEFVEFLQRIVRVESPTLVPLEVNHVMRILQRALIDAGCNARIIPGERTAGMLYALPRDRTRGRAAQAMIGHCDTVWPMGTIHEMPVRIEAKRLRGPGVYDMKGGIAQMIFALKAMRDLGLEPALTPAVLITSDEETGSVESRRTIERLARHCERVYVLEPALGLTGKIKTRRKGTGHFEVTVNDPERGLTVNVGTVAGGLRANVVAPESRAAVDVRITTRKDAARIEEAIYGLTPAIPGVTIEVTGYVDRAPMDATPRNHALWQLARLLGAEIGLELQEGMSGGASDGNFTSQFTATLDGLGPVGDGAHAQREYINIDETLERCALLTLLLLAPSVKS